MYSILLGRGGGVYCTSTYLQCLHYSILPRPTDLDSITIHNVLFCSTSDDQTYRTTNDSPQMSNLPLEEVTDDLINNH